MDFNQKILPKDGEEIVIIKTNKGEIRLRLFPKFAPLAVKNFCELIKKNYYKNTIFHRVIPNFMIQGGDPEGTGKGGESYTKKPFKDEFSKELSHIRGALAMANCGPDTNGSQFFIVQAPQTPWLDNKHTIFGQVYEGMEVVDKIANSPTEENDKPIDDILITDIKISKYKKQ
jgi:peptidyl-prolyl cis-trans isomerase B (cyclophilin B)